MTDQVTPIKGFRQKPAPTKGEIQKENQTLGQQLQERLQGLQQFFGNLINQCMQKTKAHDQELNLVSTWLGARTTEDAAQKEDHLLMDYAGVLLNDDGTEATVDVLTADGSTAKIPDYFDGGSGKLFMLTNLVGGTLIPGFEEQLVGLKAGEGKQLEVQFPKEYAVESLKDKKAKFSVYVHEVRRPIPNSPIGALIDENARIRAEARAKALADAEAAQAAALAAKKAEDEASLAAPAETSAETLAEPATTSAETSADPAPETAQATEAPAESAPETSAEQPATEAAPQTAPETSDTGAGAEQTPATT